MIGASVSHYKITSKLGEGGMGEVWRAKDTRLGRDVALKGLPENFALDSERLARFEREARVLASLSHPNIAGIYGLEEVDDRSYLVMEVAEGVTLSEKIARGPIPVKDAAQICVQIAQAVEAAHEKGIVHRDLKPGNVVVAEDGTAKVLDFGLAKAVDGHFETATSDQDLTRSPALTQAVTGAGVLLGTAAYMSPEQARGQAVDRRTDVWAFGCVFFEMLTGQRAFDGETATDLLGAIVLKEPNLEKLPDYVPPQIRRLLEHCLRKDPTRRLQAIGDARIELQDWLEAPDEVEVDVEPARPAPAKTSTWVYLPLGALAILSLVLGAILVFGDSAPEAVRRLDVRMGAQAFDRTLGSSVVLSPDGRYVAYETGVSGSSAELSVRALDRLTPTSLARGSGRNTPYHPFFSPDNEWVGYATPGELRKVSITGGSSITLCEVDRSRGASWGENDMIVFAPSPDSGLFVVPAAGGPATPLTQLDTEQGDVTHRWPQWLPGGRAVLFTSALRRLNLEDAKIEAFVPETGERKTIHHGGYYGRYVSSGHLVYVEGQSMFAVPFDAENLEKTGPPVPLLQDLDVNPVEGSAQFDIALEAGMLAYLSRVARLESYQVLWVDSFGRTEPLWAEAGAYANPRLSPDGQKLSLSIVRDNNWDVWVYDLNRKVATRLTFSEAYDADQVWSPDGKYLAFASDRDGGTHIYRKRADGSGEAERLDNIETQGWYPGSWSSDGRYIALQAASADVWILPLEGDEPYAFLTTEFVEGGPVFSPNVRWIAYESNESGRTEVYVRPFPEGAGKWQVSDGGGSQPRWSRDGRTLFYRTDAGVMSVPVEAVADSFRVGSAKELFSGVFLGGIAGLLTRGFQFPDYDAAGDGKRFVMMSGSAEMEATEDWVTLVTGWYSELEELVPSR
jgi:serine/threonine-protein kinase